MKVGSAVSFFSFLAITCKLRNKTPNICTLHDGDGTKNQGQILILQNQIYTYYTQRSEVTS